MSPELSIVIVNWNSKDYLRKCLISIYQHAGEIKPQIIVVDGASFDGCGEMLFAEFPSVSFIQSKENIGFGRCNNLGVEKASGELLLLLNPDTEMKANSLQALLRAYDNLPANSMLGPRLLNSDDSLQTTSVHAAPTPLNQAIGSEFLMRLFPKSKLWGTYEAYHTDKPTEVEAISGSCMLLPTRLFRKVGGFNPTYFMYAEDMDLCFKLRLSGSTILHIPTATITHHGGGSSCQQVSQFSTIQMKESLYKYFSINHGSNQSYFYVYLLTLFSTLKLLASLIHFLPIPISSKKKQTISFKKNFYILKWIYKNHTSNTHIHTSDKSPFKNSILSSRI
jgi:GT2 family glycosyltransferase